MPGILKSTQAITSFPLFQGLDEYCLNEIFDTKNIIRYKKGQCVYYEGARPQGVYCVLAGKLKVVKLYPEGKEQILHLVKEKDVLGLRCVMTRESYSNSAITLEESEICYLTKERFFELFSEFPAIQKKVLEYVSVRMDLLENKIVCLSQYSVRERLALNLLLLSSYFGIEKDNEVLIDISLSREDMANMIGTATETVIRLLSEFKKEGILNFSGRKMTIVNIADLKKLAHTGY